MIGVDHRDGVAVVRLEHGKVNALDVELLDALIRTLRELSSEPLVLTGQGRSFSAGVDLRRVVESDAAYASELVDAIDEAALAVFDHPRPVVAAINGHAIAGGCILAAACDVRLMSQGSIGITEVLVGVLFPAVPLEVMRHVCGPVLDELALSGRLLDPSAAVRCGLVHEVVGAEVLVDEAVRRAATLGRIPAAAYASTKQHVHGPARERIAAIRESHNAGVRAAWQDPATRASMREFLDRLAATSGARTGA